MNNKLVCPFCKEELDTENYYVRCRNPHCNETTEMEGTEEMWQALIRRTNQLNIAITDIHHAYKSLMGGCAEWRLYLEQTLKQIQDLDNE